MPLPVWFSQSTLHSQDVDIPKASGGRVITRRDFLAGAAAVALAAKTVQAGGTAVDRFWLGTSYYPDLTPRSEWGEDFRRMSDLGLKTVRMGEFAWSSMEPSDARFDFGWLDDAIGLAAQQGISVLLGSPTAAVPAWLHRAHPDVLGGNERGPYTFGGRKGFSLHSEAAQLAARRVLRALANRYATNPAVVGWQLSNEPGYPFTAYDPAGIRAFRVWLKERYKTLDGLNEAWGAKFWSNTYDSWDEIEFPVNQAESGFWPAVRLDYRRFFSDSWLKWLRMEADSLRAAGARQMIYANWPEATWSVDIHRTEPFLDATAWDNYGRMADDRDPHSQWYAAMNHDLCRGSRKDGRFFVAEQRSQAPASSGPEAVRLQTLAEVAYGASGALYFEWRPPVSGSERGYVSVLEKDGSFGASVQEIRRVRAEIDKLWPRLKGTKTQAKVAMLFSFDNQWDRGFGDAASDASGTSYKANFERFYAGAKALHTNVDVIAPTTALDAYSLVVAPGLQMVSDDIAAGLHRFVKRGGCLVLDQGTGTRDEVGHDRRMRGPGVFAEIAGVRVVASSRVAGNLDGYSISLRDDVRSFAGPQAIEVLELQGAREIGFLTRPKEDALPVVTENSFGSGHVLYVATGSSDLTFYEEVLKRAGRAAGVLPILDVPAGVDVVSRTSATAEYVFVMNMTTEAQTIPEVGSFRDAFTDEKIASPMILASLDARVLVRGS